MSSDTYTVVSTMKNEGPYILEWIAHYKTLGFDKFVVCTNDCSDTTVEILQRLQEIGLVTHHATFIRKGGIHRSALRQANRYPEVQDAKWVFVCDVDEFLNIHIGDGKVRTLIEASGEQADVISVPWRIFGANAVDMFEDVAVTQQFMQAELPFEVTQSPLTGKFVKSLYTNKDKFKRMGLHAPVPFPENVGELNYVLPGGAKYLVNGKRTEHPPVFKFAQINHYALRSRDSFLIKRARGRANHTHHVLGLDYWQRFNLNDEKDTSIYRYKDQVSAYLAELKSDPLLSDLHDRSVVWHKRKAQSIKMDPEMDELVASLQD